MSGLFIFYYLFTFLFAQKNTDSHRDLRQKGLRKPRLNDAVGQEKQHVFEMVPKEE